MVLELHSDNPQPPVLESDRAASPPDPATEPYQNEHVTSYDDWPNDAGIQILRATRSWIQYGTLGFAVFCILIGAVEALFGR
jgi:hypothetical protein